MPDEVFTDETLPYTFEPITEAGAPGKIDAASVVAASSDLTIVQVVGVVATESQITFQANPIMVPLEGEGATRTITVTADADLGEGVSTITGFAEIIVKQRPGAPATAFRVTAGPPVPKVATPVG